MIRLLLLLCTTIYCFSMTAQQTEIEAKIEAKKIAYISQTLDLKPKEAEKFWPLYNAYRSDIKSLRPLNKKYKEGQNEDDSLTLNQHLEAEQKMLTLKKEFALDVSQIIGEDRTLKLLKSERKFKEKMLRGMKERYKGKNRGR